MTSERKIQANRQLTGCEIERRLQLPTHPRLAEGFLAQNPDRNLARHHHPISAQSGFLTDD